MVRCNVGTIDGTVVNPSGYEQYTKTQVNDWKSNAARTHKIQKEPHTGEVFFSAETNWIYFKLELNGKALHLQLSARFSSAAVAGEAQ